MAHDIAQIARTEQLPSRQPSRLCAVGAPAIRHSEWNGTIVGVQGDETACVDRAMGGFTRLVDMQRWMMMLELSSMLGIDPQTYFADVINRIESGWPLRRLCELTFANWLAQQPAQQ